MKNLEVNTKPLRFMLSIAILSVLLQGCSGIVLKQVPESKRDTAGAFDGTWQGTVVSTAGRQTHRGWVFSCGDLKGESIGALTVNQGVAQIGGVDGPVAYVNDAGKFRFEIPMSVVAAAHGTSDSSINNGAMTYIVYGSLENQKGRMTFGIADFSNNGCTSKVHFNKI